MYHWEIGKFRPRRFRLSSVTQMADRRRARGKQDPGVCEGLAEMTPSTVETARVSTVDGVISASRFFGRFGPVAREAPARLNGSARIGGPYVRPENSTRLERREPDTPEAARLLY